MTHYMMREVAFLCALAKRQSLQEQPLSQPRLASSAAGHSHPARFAILATILLFVLAAPIFAQSAGPARLRPSPRTRPSADVSVTVGETTGGSWSDTNPDTFVVEQPGALLSVAEVVDRLNSGVPVHIVADSGDISIDAPITWISNAWLILDAGYNVAVNADVTATGDSATLYISPLSGTGASYSLGRGARITLSGSNPSLFIGNAPYVVINSVDSLQSVRDNLSLNYALGSDIDASPTWQWNPTDGYSGFVPLGSDETPFTGTFDGLGHAITGLYMYWVGTSYVALFGDLSPSGTVKNVGLLWEGVNGHYYVGGLVGLNEGLISGAFNTGTVTGAAVGAVNMAGGLVGYNSTTGIITQSYSTAAVTGGWGTGGLVGQTDGTISNSFSMGQVIGYNPGWSIGGFTGWYNLGNIAYSYSTGYVTGGGATVGAFVGGYGGGGGTVTGNYFDQSKSGAGGSGATGLSTAQMMQMASFSGWDFTNVWDISEGYSYPHLRQMKRTVPAGSQCATQPSGLLGWWPAEGNGNDTTGNDNVVPSTSGVSFETGLVGQAFRFDGSTGYSERPETSSAVNIGDQSLTVSAWIQAYYTETNTEELVSRYACGANSDCSAGIDGPLYELLLAGGRPQFNVRDNFSEMASAEGVDDLRDGRWHLLVGTLDRSAGQIRIYVDGVLQDVQDASRIASIDDSVSPLEFGRLFRQGWASPAYYFDGLLDEVQIYNRALSAVEVQSIFDAGSKGVCTADPGIFVKPSALKFATTQGGDNPPSESIYITNIGVGNVGWTASATPSWLSLNLTEGTTPTTVSVSVDATDLPPGVHTGTVTIMGGAGSPAEVTVTFNVMAPPNSSITTLSSSPNPSPYGSVVTLTATVTGGSTVPTGTVTFIDETAPDAVSLPLDATGTAVFSSSTFSVGTHSIIAVYNGDSGHLPSTTSALTQVVTPGACYAVPNGLVNWWAAEGNANDSIGKADGTLVGSPAFGTGIAGQGFNFDGAGQYVSIPNSPVLQNRAWTVSAWFQTASGGGIFSMQTDAYGSPLVSQGGNWQPLMYVGTDGRLHGGAWPAKFTSPQIVWDEAWHHAVVSYDGSTLTEYLDGLPFGYIPGITEASFATTYIGTAYTVYWDYAFNGWYDFNGAIDEVTVFNRALSTAEIQGLYSGTSAGFCRLPVPLISSISPSSVVAGTQYMDLTVHGSNFTTASIVYWNDSPRPTTYTDETTLQVDLTSTDLASAGTVSISVQNPPPGGGSTERLPFTIAPRRGGTSDMMLAAGIAPMHPSEHPMYQAVITNMGPDPATNAVITDVLDRFQYVSATYTTGATEGPCAFDADSSMVTCNIGSMPSGATGTIKVIVTVPSSGWASQDFYASADQDDPVPVNNSARVVSAAGDYNTAVGLNELVQTTDGALVAFSKVTKSGNTTVSASALTIAPPAGFRAGNPAVMYTADTSATFAGPVAVTLPFSAAGFHKPAKVRLFHLENGAWADRTSGLDLTSGRISAMTASLSSFAIFEPVNHSPVAIAGAIQAVSASSSGGATVRLDASASTDSDSDSLSYRWAGPFPEGNGSVIGATPAVALPVGISKLTLIANDGELDSIPSDVTATVSDFKITAANSSTTIAKGQSAIIDIAVSAVYGDFTNPVALTCPSLPQGLSCSFSPATVVPGHDAATTRLTISRTTTASTHRSRVWMLSCFSMAAFGFICMPLRRRRARLWIVLTVLTFALALLIACGGITPQTSSQTTSTESAATITVTGSAQSLHHSTVVTVTMN